MGNSLLPVLVELLSERLTQRKYHVVKTFYDLKHRGSDCCIVTAFDRLEKIKWDSVYWCIIVLYIFCNRIKN